TDEYSHGDAISAPIMGYGYGKRNVWWSGPSSNSSADIQNDVGIIARSSNGFGYRQDDHPGSYSSAEMLGGAGRTRSAAGVIEKSTDRDWFGFNTTGGSVTINVNVTP